MFKIVRDIAPMKPPVIISVSDIPVGQVFEARLHKSNVSHLYWKFGGTRAWVIVQLDDPTSHWVCSFFDVYDYRPMVATLRVEL